MAVGRQRQQRIRKYEALLTGGRVLQHRQPLGAAMGMSRGSRTAAPLRSPELRVAASMIGGAAVTRILMGAPYPYGGSQGAPGRSTL